MKVGVEHLNPRKKDKKGDSNTQLINGTVNTSACNCVKSAWFSVIGNVE